MIIPITLVTINSALIIYVKKLLAFNMYFPKKNKTIISMIVIKATASDIPIPIITLCPIPFFTQFCDSISEYVSLGIPIIVPVIIPIINNSIFSLNYLRKTGEAPVFLVFDLFSDTAVITCKVDYLIFFRYFFKEL